MSHCHLDHSQDEIVKLYRESKNKGAKKEKKQRCERAETKKRVKAERISMGRIFAWPI